MKKNTKVVNVVIWMEAAGTAQMSRKIQMEEKNPCCIDITKSMVIERWGIWKKDMYYFSRAAVWGGMQAGQWGRSWTWRSAGNATVAPFQPGTLLP